MKYKYVILGIFITFFCFLFFFCLNSLISARREITIKQVSKYSEKVKYLKVEIEKVKSDECRASLDSILNKIESTYYKRNITIKEYVDNYYKDVQFLYLLENAKDVCTISDKAYENLYIHALASTVYPSTLKQEYALRYIFKIQDFSSLKELNKQTDTLGSYTNKTLELNVLKDLISEVGR